MIMKKNFNIGWVLVAWFAAGQFYCLHAADVQRFLFTKGQEFVQTNPAVVTSLTNQLPFRFVSTVDATATDSVLQARIKLPNLQFRTLTNAGDGNFDFEQGYNTKALLDGNYAVGNYYMFMVGTNDHTNIVLMPLAAENYPNIPKLASWPDLQAVEAAQPLNLAWNIFTNGTANDFILLDISDTNGLSIVATPAMFVSGALDGTSLTAQIPAATLADDTVYQGTLLFLKRTLLNTASYPGANGAAGYYRQTRFPLVTLPTPPDSGRIQFDAQNYSVAETAGAANVTITRSGSVGDVSVDFTTQSGTAVDGADYTGVPTTTVTFLNGETVKTMPVTVIDNFLLDSNRTVNLWLTNPQGGAVLGNRTNSVLTILDNEIARAGKIQFATRSNSIPEAGRLVTLTLNRIGGSAGTVSVTYETTNGTAIEGQNYSATSGTVTFTPGLVTKTITIPIINDTDYESNEVFQVNLVSTTGGAALGTNYFTKVGIVNDDLGGTFAFKQNSYLTNENSTNFVITVVRTGGVASGVTVDYATADGSALADVRYYATNGTLTFGAGQLSQTFLVGITNDLIPNGNQSFFVSLTNATGGAKVSTNPALNTATLTIKDDESSVAFSNTTYSISEAGGALAVTVFRTGALFTQVSVDFNLEDLTTTVGQDYRATNGTLVFPPNVAAKTFSIVISNDTLVEGNETFALHLTNPQGGVALGANSNAVVTIVDNDFGGAIRFATNSYTVSEAGTNAIITLVRSNGLASGVTVDLLVEDGTATAGVDYSNITQTLTFNAGETNKKVLLPIYNNTIVDGTRTALLTLTNAGGGGSLGTRTNATLAITDNDLGGTINFSRPAYSQFESGTNFYITVTRAGGKASGVTVDYFTTEGTATSDVDYTNTFGTLTFAAGETNKIISIGIINDALHEGNETFTLSLTNVIGGATLGATNLTTLTIVDDESTVGFSTATYATNEAAGNLLVTVTRTGSTLTPVNISYFTLADATALPGVNFTSVANTLVFPANVSSKTFLVPLINNTLAQGNVTFSLVLTNVTGGAAIGIQQAVATIIDNDFAGTVGFATTNFFVTDAGTNAVITLVRSNGIASGVTVNFVTQDGTATDGVDYTNASQTLTFAAGEISKKVFVPVAKKTFTDVNRTVALSLQSTGSAALGRSSATLNIVENKTALGIEFADYSASKTSTNILVRLVRSGSLTTSVSATYATLNGTAIAPTDYKATTGSIIFPANTNSKTISIPIVTNSPSPAGRSFSFRLSAPIGCILGPITNSSIAIQDNSSAPSVISFSAVNFPANKTNANALVTLTRSGGLAASASVNIFTVDATADEVRTSGANGTATTAANDPYFGNSYDTNGFGDYQSINHTVTFPAGSNSLTVAIPLLNNPIGGIRSVDRGSNRWFNCSLANPQGTSLLGSVTSARVDIADTLNHGSVQFSAASYSASASSLTPTTGSVDIILNRTGGAAGIILVHFLPTHSGDTAQPPFDFYGIADNTEYNEVTFADGETSKVLTLNLNVYNTTSYPKTAHLSYNTLRFGAVSGSISNAVLTITP